MIKPYITKSILMACSIICLSVSAQDQASKNIYGNEGRWYQVEIIIFTQNDELNTEQWSTDIALSYPPKWKDLEPLTDEKISERTEQLLTTEAFYELPVSERLLNNNARDLKRSKKHRVLYHKAWRQPVWSRSEAPSLLISGGDQYGEEAELNGSINLSVARYLHLNTNLWFTQFANNYGQEVTEWPILPTPPSITDDIKQSVAKSETVNLWDNIAASTNEYDSILTKPYVSEKVVLLQQKRRMRSKEIHYIDHPVVGIIFYAIPYELPSPLSPLTTKAPDA